MTHTETDTDEVLNEDALALFPSLRRRSADLLGTGARKTRSDKIDLELISDFMHDYCRYVLLLLNVDIFRSAFNLCLLSLFVMLQSEYIWQQNQSWRRQISCNS